MPDPFGASGIFIFASRIPAAPRTLPVIPSRYHGKAPMDDTLFRTQAEAAIDSLFRRLTAASDRYGFEPDMNGGALTVEFDEPPAKFVVSPNSPVHQIWVSANVQSFKLEWDAAAGAFKLPPTGQTLPELMAEAIGKHLGESVTL